MLIMDECESVSAVECMSDSREREVEGWGGMLLSMERAL